MIPPSFIRLAVVVAMGICLAGCGRTESYRYKLTLAVNTPEGVKHGSSVAEVTFWEVSFPARGVANQLRGEALYVDLGPGAKPLIALLSNQLHPKYGENTRWSRDAGPDFRFLSRLYGKASTGNFMDDVGHIARLRGPRRITPDDLPDLVTFADVNDPKSVIEVDPKNLQATLGPNITWNEITLAITDEPITSDIKTRLSWLPAAYHGMLDGDQYHGKNTLANTLSTADFDQSGDLKKSK